MSSLSYNNQRRIKDMLYDRRSSPGKASGGTTTSILQQRNNKSSTLTYLIVFFSVILIGVAGYFIYIRVNEKAENDSQNASKVKELNALQKEVMDNFDIAECSYKSNIVTTTAQAEAWYNAYQDRLIDIEETEDEETKKVVAELRDYLNRWLNACNTELTLNAQAKSAAKKNDGDGKKSQGGSVVIGLVVVLMVGFIGWMMLGKPVLQALYPSKKPATGNGAGTPAAGTPSAGTQQSGELGVGAPATGAGVSVND